RRRDDPLHRRAGGAVQQTCVVLMVDEPAHPRRNSDGEDQPADHSPSMTTKQYLAALKKLGLTPHGIRTAKVLGQSHRQVQRFAAGEAPIPEPVALLIGMYQKHGLPDDGGPSSASD